MRETDIRSLLCEAGKNQMMWVSGGFVVNSHYSKVVSFRLHIHSVYWSKLTHTSLSLHPVPRSLTSRADSKDSLKEGWWNMKTFHVQHAKRLNWCITFLPTKLEEYFGSGEMHSLLLKCVCLCVCVHAHMFLHMPMDASRIHPHTPLVKNPLSFFSQPTLFYLYICTPILHSITSKGLFAVQCNPSGGLDSGSWRDFLMLWRKIVLSPTVSETDWDLGPFVAVLAPGQMSPKQQNTKKV